MKIVYLASIATKRQHFDGERNKSLDVLKALKTKYKRVKSFNLGNRYLQPFVMALWFLWIIFWKPDCVFIAKSPSGAGRALAYLRRLKFDMRKVVIYSYGLGIDGGFQRYIKDTSIFKEAGLIIAENTYSRESFEKHGCERLATFPCLKPSYTLPADGPFCQKKTLKSLFFARLTEDKGLFIAIESVIEVNERAGFEKFTLDIAGKPKDKETEDKIKSFSNKYGYIRYLGTSFTITGRESYLRLMTYDLNIFPSYYEHECAPGSVVDMFIAGIPTLSSDFDGSHIMLGDDCAYFAPQRDLDANIRVLETIYDHQEELHSKRESCRKRAPIYSYEEFLKVFDSAVSKIDSKD